ncbi:hypothetical protein [Nostoc sp.]
MGNDQKKGSVIEHSPLLAEAPEMNYHYSPANMKPARLEEFC